MRVRWSRGSSETRTPAARQSLGEALQAFVFALAGEHDAVQPARARPDCFLDRVQAVKNFHPIQFTSEMMLFEIRRFGLTINVGSQIPGFLRLRSSHLGRDFG